jgi:hypothetical protein
MADEPAYLDLHQGFWREQFQRAREWGDYLAVSEEKHRDRWLQAMARTHPTAEQAHLLGSFTRQINLLVLSGVWCGDCVRQGPIYKLLADAAPTLALRLADRDEQPELTDMLRVNGAKKVPVAVFLSEDFFEVARFGDRTLSIYRAKAHRDLGPSCETGIVPPDADALATEVQEWVDIAERVHLILRTAPMLRQRYGD